MTNETSEDTKQALLQKLANERVRNKGWGDFCSVCSKVFIGIAIFASVGSAAAAAFSPFGRTTATVLTAIPGLAILVEKSFVLTPLANWHWLVQRRIEGLENALRFENASVEEISKKFTVLILEMDGIYPRGGAVGGAPAKVG